MSPSTSQRGSFWRRGGLAPNGEEKGKRGQENHARPPARGGRSGARPTAEDLLRCRGVWGAARSPQTTVWASHRPDPGAPLAPSLVRGALLHSARRGLLHDGELVTGRERV
jgi:hypothetical protein